MNSKMIVKSIGNKFDNEAIPISDPNWQGLIKKLRCASLRLQCSTSLLEISLYNTLRKYGATSNDENKDFNPLYEK